MYCNEVMVDGDLNVILLNLDVYHILSGIFDQLIVIITWVLLKLLANGDLDVYMCLHELSDLMGMVFGSIYRCWLFYAF